MKGGEVGNEGNHEASSEAVVGVTKPWSVSPPTTFFWTSLLAGVMVGGDTNHGGCGGINKSGNDVCLFVWYTIHASRLCKAPYQFLCLMSYV